MSRPQLTALLLALGTLLVYLPAASHGFSIFDDGDYVTQNRIVQDGLTWAGVKWAFTTWHASNWHPLTWLSHMLDCELFGLNAGAHHTINVLLHATNVVLLFVLLLRWTGALRTGAFVAALFAWCPLHVESVAWISERKDVLSTCFALLALLAYTRYVQGGTSGKWQVTGTHSTSPPVTRHPSHFYWLALFFFTLSLMAKPMLVTLPLVLLLLDYWPLGRISEFGVRPALRSPWVKDGSSELKSSPAPRIEEQPGFSFSPLKPRLSTLLFEKWPFFLLAAISCVITFRAQHHGGMVVSLEEMPTGYRLDNVLLGYARYLFKLIWPVHLAIFYPLPKTISPAAVLAAAAILLALSAAAWLGRKRGPYGLVGWLWFLGTLVPVIGLVQVGQAAMADRYTYFPSIGLFIALAFAARDGVQRFRFPSLAITGAAVLVLGGCLVLMENQLRCWRDDESLFSHAIQVTRDNEPAHLCLAQVYEMAGRKAEAVDEYHTALGLNPHRVKTYNSLAMLLASSGRTNEALAELQTALRLYPADAASHDSLANLLADSGHTNEALAEFREAVRINPQDNVFQNNLGALLAASSRFGEAMEHYAAAARADPADWRAPYLTGKALLKQGRDEAAVPYFRQALQLDPDNLHVLTWLAQVLASDENPRVRDGGDALALASRANDLTGGVQPAMLDVLAMACAELGRFDEAQKAGQAALDLTLASNQTNDAATVQRRLQLYQNHQPFRQSFASRP